jgi:hypothetical protein
MLGLLVALALPATASGQTWLPVQTLSAPGGSAMEAQVAFDTAGNALAI